MNLELIAARTILKAVVGSHSLGLNTAESDIDEMGICIEPIEASMGLSAPFEQYVRTGPDATRVGPDLQIYGLRKYMRLALSGNPTILALLFIPTDALISFDARGSQLRDLTPKIISRKAGKAFLGYLQAQKQRFLGERGNGGHGAPRSKYVNKYGYDSKYAMHMLRLGLQGVELLNTGRINYPMVVEDRTYLMTVRNGQQEYNDILTKCGELEQELKQLLDSSPIQAEPQTAEVEEWMLRMYERAWGADRKTKDIIEDAAIFAARGTMANPHFVTGLQVLNG